MQKAKILKGRSEYLFQVVVKKNSGSHCQGGRPQCIEKTRALY